MEENKPYVEVCCYNDRGDPLPPNIFRPELVLDDITMLLNFREYGNPGCMPINEANLLAKKIATKLGIEVKLAEE